MAIAVLWGVLIALLVWVADSLPVARPQPILGEVSLSRGAANELFSGTVPSFSFNTDIKLRGGLYWRQGVIRYTDGVNEITRDQLKARLNAEQWAQVEAAERRPICEANGEKWPARADGVCYAEDSNGYWQSRRSSR